MISFGSTWQPFENSGYGCFQGIPTDKLEAPQPAKGETIHWLDEPHDIYIPNLLGISEYKESRVTYDDVTTINNLVKPLDIRREQIELLNSSNYNDVTPPTSSAGSTATADNSSGVSHDFVTIMHNSPSAPVYTPLEQSYNSALHSSPTAPKYPTQVQKELPKSNISMSTVIKTEIELQRERNERFLRLQNFWPAQSEKLGWGKLNPDLGDRFKPVETIPPHECTKDCYVPGTIISGRERLERPLHQGQSILIGRSEIQEKSRSEDKLGSFPTKNSMEPVGVRKSDYENLKPFFNLMWVHQERTREGLMVSSKAKQGIQGEDDGDNPSQGCQAWNSIIKVYPIPTRASSHIITLNEIASLDATKVEKRETKAHIQFSSSNEQAFSYFANPPCSPPHERAESRTHWHRSSKRRGRDDIEDSTPNPPYLIPDIPFSFNTCKIWSQSCPHRQSTKPKPWNNFPTPEVFVHNQKPNITIEGTPKELTLRPKHSTKTNCFASVVENFHRLESQLPWYKTHDIQRSLEKDYPTPSKTWCDSIKDAKLKELKLLYANTFPCEQRELAVDGKAESEYWQMESECRRRYSGLLTRMVDERVASLRSQDGAFVEDDLLGVKRRYILKQVCQTMGQKGMAYFEGHGRQYTESKQKQDDGRAPMMYFPSLQMLQGLS